MLKTNSKKARENVRAYIMEREDCAAYEPEREPETFPEIAAFILAAFRREKAYTYEVEQDIPEAVRFADWAAGLPSILDTCYYYNRSAVDDLGAILDETEAEKARYSESEAESLLTTLIYRELLKGEKENA